MSEAVAGTALDSGEDISAWDTIRLGDRTIRITGIDAPEIARPLCPAEGELGRRSAERLLALLNQGPFTMTAHKLYRTDQYNRELMAIERCDVDLGDTLMNEGLAHRYVGSKRNWC